MLEAEIRPPRGKERERLINAPGLNGPLLIMDGTRRHWADSRASGRASTQQAVTIEDAFSKSPADYFRVDEKAMRLAGRLEQARQIAKSMFDKSVLETSHSSNRIGRPPWSSAGILSSEREA